MVLIHIHDSVLFVNGMLLKSVLAYGHTMSRCYAKTVIKRIHDDDDDDDNKSTTNRSGVWASRASLIRRGGQQPFN